MRETKFKFWLGHTKKMTYEHSLKDISHMHWDLTKDILPLQFTGLEDKNGKEIYEGDIVEFQHISKGVINWNHQYCGFWIDFIDSNGVKRYSNLNVTFSDGDVYMCGSIKAIGNIYENPELLK